MSSDDQKSLESLSLSASERAALEVEERRRLDELAAEVQRRYDPARLGRLTVAGAGRTEKLDDETRRRMEARLGTGFSDVRVVRGAFADRVTQRHRADAVTIGSTGVILMRDTPRTNLKSPEGRALLAHELTHVRQAKGGMHFALERGSDGAAHEQEAEQVERTVLRDEKSGVGTVRASMAAKEQNGETVEAWRARVVARVLALSDSDAIAAAKRRGR